MPIAAHFEENLAENGPRGDQQGVKPRAQRRRLLLETQGALASGVEMPVVIHNFSESGMLMESRIDLEIGETIDVELPQAGITRARVVWASGKLYGCAFDAPISSSVLSAAQLRSAVQEVDLGASPMTSAPAAIGGESFGERLHRLRKLRGFTQGELAARLGVSKPTVWAWEQGRARPIEERLDAIAEELGVTAAELRPGRTVAGLPELIARCREQIAAAVETSPDKVRIMIEL
ncbi:helix-turn-helix domain-containing protein [Novosphingobium aerophilum]|uniref:helix-turn-helix domain-containing protein n=1 Tax=Novosphingobium TaxID=165696 RepID=UPI002D781F2F|nr:helix-turn-helix domain-containing protein [Novosphingobium sp. RL4]WRT93950.1 helix-turn-helix domain-containing protein [Novosphingobium sp. RL4]